MLQQLVQYNTAQTGQKGAVESSLQRAGGYAAMGVLLVLDSLYTECYNNWCNSTLHRLDIKSPERAPLVL